MECHNSILAVVSTLVWRCICTSIYTQLLCSFPGLPRFSSLICVQYNTRKREERESSEEEEEVIREEKGMLEGGSVGREGEEGQGEGVEWKSEERGWERNSKGNIMLY